MIDPIIQAQALSFPWQPQDPFLFCAYHLDHYPPGDGNLRIRPETLGGRRLGADFASIDGFNMYHGETAPGFPYHPHRGFETVTIAEQGLVDHSDSMGAAGRFGNGDVQWMTAGRGVLHSEMFPLLNDQEGNTGELFQIWLNLPKANKMVEPHFKMLWREQIPVVNHQDAAGRTTRIKVIAGQLGDAQAVAPPPNSWAAADDHKVGIFTIVMEPHAEWTLPATAAGVLRSMAFYKGDSLQVADRSVTGAHELRLRPQESVTLVNGPTESRILILEGMPIRETVIAHGPFVMNSKTEILEAYQEYQETQFGGWPWPQQEQLHPAERGRFALHANGQEEYPQA